MKRKIEFDILKGILIIFVVTGHMGINIGFDVYWFHMPAFFMITGYLTSSFVSIERIYTSIRHNNPTRKEIFKKIKKFIIPYLTYCILFILLMRRNIFMDVLKMLYGGRYNTTSYSFPYWFINALLIGIIYYGSIRNKKYCPYILLFIYLLIHTNLFKFISIPLPWGIDEGLGAVIYIAIGDFLKRIDLYKPRYYPIIIIPFIIIILNYLHILDYKLSMKYMIYNNIILDIIVPLSFTYLLFCISKILSSHPIIRKPFITLGISSMTIYFTHGYLISISRGFGLSSPLLLIPIVLCGLLFHYCVKTNKYTSLLFLGR